MDQAETPDAFIFPMNYTKMLLVQRQEELEQQLLIADSMSDRMRIDIELEQIEAALMDEEVQ